MDSRIERIWEQDRRARRRDVPPDQGRRVHLPCRGAAVALEPDKPDRAALLHRGGARLSAAGQHRPGAAPASHRTSLRSSWMDGYGAVIGEASS